MAAVVAVVPHGAMKGVVGTTQLLIKRSKNKISTPPTPKPQITPPPPNNQAVTTRGQTKSTKSTTFMSIVFNGSGIEENQAEENHMGTKARTYDIEKVAQQIRTTGSLDGAGIGDHHGG